MRNKTSFVGHFSTWKKACLLLTVVFFFNTGSSLFAQNDVSNTLPETMIGKSLKSTLKFLHKEFDMEFAYDVELLKNKG